MTENFDFEDGGRKYTCSIEAPQSTRADAWWWFDVTGDRYRYAPFRAEAGDTKRGVQSKILAYYTAILERRSIHLPYRPYRPR